MRHRNIEIGKIYELKVRSFSIQMWDGNGNPIPSECHQIDGADKRNAYKRLIVETRYQTGLVLEKTGKKNVAMRCMVGTDDIWLTENSFEQELTKKRARQLAKSQ